MKTQVQMVTGFTTKKIRLLRELRQFREMNKNQFLKVRAVRAVASRKSLWHKENVNCANYCAKWFLLRELAQ